MIVMKKALCNFKDVAKKVANKKVTLTAEQILKIISQVVNAMNHLYGKVKIAHCDVKPENILQMDLDYTLMMGDFGVSK